MSFAFTLNPSVPQHVADSLALVAAFVNDSISTKPSDAANAVLLLGEVEAAINRLV
jgi:hypothetical protein